MRKVSRALQVMQAMQFLGSAAGNFLFFKYKEEPMSGFYVIKIKSAEDYLNVIGYHKCLLDTNISRMLLDLCRSSNMHYQHQIY